MAEEVKLTRLRDKLIKGLLEVEDVRLNGHPTKRLPGNVNVSVYYAEGESILLSLDLKGLLFQVVRLVALVPWNPLMSSWPWPRSPGCHGSLRFTLGKDNTEEEVNYTIGVFQKLLIDCEKCPRYERVAILNQQ